MTAPANGACAAWIAWEALPCTLDLSVFGDEDAQDAMKVLILQAVSNRLWEGSCRQYGPCETTMRPVPCCRHYRLRCGCGSYSIVDLGTEPVFAVSEVLIDGVALSEDAYRVDDWRWLVRLDGESWPSCNDLSVDDDEVGAFTVTWTYGLEVPPEGIIAAKLLTCDYAGQLIAACGPPANAESIAREGVTIILNSKSKTGIKFVDDWLDTFNCGGRIFDPGVRPALMHTNT